MAKVKGRVEIREEECKGCGLCIDVCPKGVLRFSKKFNVQGYHPAEVDPEKAEECIACSFCALMCPDVVITVYRTVDSKV
jgi:2-oxoglutarate ferredoxin oxidoreductase subunit delta